jgi:hypothetical protein
LVDQLIVAVVEVRLVTLGPFVITGGEALAQMLVPKAVIVYVAESLFWARTTLSTPAEQETVDVPPVPDVDTERS